MIAIFAEEINKYTTEEQLKFYKQKFEYQHCQLNGCENEVTSDWVIFKDTLYCRHCYDFMVDEEYSRVKDEIQRLRRKIRELEDESNMLENKIKA